MDKIADSAQKVGDAAGTVAQKTKGLSTAAAAGVAGLTGLAVSAGRAADDLNTLAKQSGFGTDEIQKWQYAADRVDVSVDDIVGAAQKMKKNMVSTSADVTAAWDQLGVSVTDNNGELRDSTEVFYEVLAALSQVENETERDILAMQLFGKSADSLAGIVDDGGAALRELGAEAEAAGLILSQDALDGANAFNDGLDTIKAKAAAAAMSAGGALAENLLPLLDTLVGKMSGVLGWVAQLDGGQLQLLATILLVVAAISPVASIIQGISGAVTALTAIIPAITGGIALFTGAATTGSAAATAFAGALTFITGPVGIVIAAIAGIIAILVVLWNNIILSLSAPTKNGAAVIRQLGLEVFDADGKMRSFSEIFPELNAALSELTDQQKIDALSTIFNNRDIAAVEALLGTTTDRWRELGGAILDAEGAAEKMAAVQLDNLQGDVTLLKSAFDALKITISDALTPSIREFAQFGSKSMDELRKGFQENGVTGFMNALSKIVTDGVAMLSQKAPEFVGVSWKFVDAMATGILNAKDQILSAFNQSANILISGADVWLSQHASSLYDFGMRMVDSIFNAFSNAGSVISEHIGKFVPLIANAFLSYHENLFTVGLNILGAIGEGLVKSKDKIQEMASSTIANMVNALTQNAPSIFNGGIALIEALVGSLLENATLIAESAVEIVAQLATSIGESAPNLIPAAVEAVLKFLEGLTNPESLNNLINGALSLIRGLGDGIIKSIPLLIAYGPEIVANLASGIISALPQMLEIGGQLLMGLLEGLGQAIVAIPAAIGKVVNAVIGGFKSAFGIHSPSTVFADMGGMLVQGLLNGISNAWSGLKNFVGGLVDGLVGGVKSLLGIHSPSTVFAGIGGNMALGLGKGWEDEYADIRREIENGLSFSAGNIGVTATGTYNTAGTAQSAPQAGFVGGGNTTINIYNPEKRDAITEAREWKKMTQRMAMSYV